MIYQDYIQQLEQTLQRNQELQKENEKLKNEIEQLKRRLLFYENPNTPPSARKIQKADKTSTENTPVPKKRGAPNGHKGATRPTREPDEIIDVIADHCEKCNSSNIEKHDKCETSVIEDLPPISPCLYCNAQIPFERRTKENIGLPNAIQ